MIVSAGVCSIHYSANIFIIEIIFEEVNPRRKDGNGMNTTTQPMFLQKMFLRG